MRDVVVWGRFPGQGEPTEAQKKSGKYPKRLYEWMGLKIRVECEAGTWRRGRAANGTEWATLMNWGYGYFEDSKGVDGDEVDVYIGPRPDDAPYVYVVHQACYGDWQKYDEDKCMIGFMSESDARDAFLACYDDPRFLGPIDAMPVIEFVAKVIETRNGAKMIERDPVVIFVKSHISGYTKADGTYVAPHEDKRVSGGENAKNQDHHAIVSMALNLSNKGKTLESLVSSLMKVNNSEWKHEKELNSPAFARAYRAHYSDASIVAMKISDLDKKYPKLKIMKRISGEFAIQILSDYANHRYYEPSEMSLKAMIEDSKPKK